MNTCVFRRFRVQIGQPDLITRTQFTSMLALPLVAQKQARQAWDSLGYEGCVLGSHRPVCRDARSAHASPQRNLPIPWEYEGELMI
jgi:hypothetical protein